MKLFRKHVVSGLSAIVGLLCIMMAISMVYAAQNNNTGEAMQGMGGENDLASMKNMTLEMINNTNQDLESMKVNANDTTIANINDYISELEYIKSNVEIADSIEALNTERTSLDELFKTMNGTIGFGFPMNGEKPNMSGMGDQAGPGSSQMPQMGNQTGPGPVMGNQSGSGPSQMPQMGNQTNGQPPMQGNGSAMMGSPEQNTEQVQNSSEESGIFAKIIGFFKSLFSSDSAAISSTTTTTTSDSSAYTQSGETLSKSDMEITATNTDESAIKVTDGGSFTLSDSTITKTGDTSSTDNSDFYGLNAGVLSESGSNIELSNCTVTTNANGANAVFATGSGSSITLSDVKIETSQDGSRGVDATLGGTITCTDVDISTQGAHCATIATDRGSGTITVTGGTMTTAGDGSPAVYSTGNITVSDATLTATGSEAAVIEGKNTITLNDCIITGMKKCGAMLYQSFSGDAEVGTSVFTMNGGSLTAAVGPLFYSTNTNAVFNLNGVELTGNSDTLLTASADRWGTEGSNGATVAFNANAQLLDGNITCDNISSITVTLHNGTTLTGAINTENTAGMMALNIDSSSTWNVTGTSYLTTFTDDDSTLSNIDDNGYTIYYDSSNSANSWLESKTYDLNDGGKLTPISS
ncbi:right-handed parallel beta-helix repeat-containing protein [uncultured Methanomethylovorans sp.]|uniref:right-handed parallel beta-helix repeat-containing protein n=1 Tax=uncultured Methanomethylovorans sp. TaxID=183759 RepID=UPI002AA80F61|nr:right-handed parallel beta-helix repeat-containing protein [uncultured Methanomethylovorans sp.]